MVGKMPALKPKHRQHRGSCDRESQGIKRRRIRQDQPERTDPGLVNVREDDVHGEPHREIEDHADNAGGDRRQRSAQSPVAAQPLDVGRAEEDPQKTGHERHPGGEEAAEDAGSQRIEPVGSAIGAEKGDELHNQDQRAGRGLGEAQSRQHLAWRQPAVGFDRLLRDIGKNGVGAAEGDDGHFAEEDPDIDERGRPAEHRGQRQRRPEP